MVGELVIDARSGAVLKERWPTPPAPGAASGGDGRFASSGGDPGLRGQMAQRWEVAKTKFSEGTAAVKKNAKTAGASVGAWFRNVADAATGGGGAKVSEPAAPPVPPAGQAVVPRAVPATYGYQRSAGADAGRYH